MIHCKKLHFSLKSLNRNGVWEWDYTVQLAVLAYQFDVLKELNDCWVDEVVATTIGNECLDDGLKKIVSDNVAIVEFILETNYPSTESQSSWREEREGGEGDENTSKVPIH